jgi:hypothetical protein
VEIKYNDGLETGKRIPKLFFFKEGQKPVKFSGKSIAGVAAVVAADYKKNGQWSSTAYKIVLAQGVTALRVLRPLHCKTICTDVSSVENMMTRNVADNGASHDFTKVMTPDEFLEWISENSKGSYALYVEAQQALNSLE